MINFQNVSLLFAALCTALMAGLFYSYSCSVNPGLGKLQDENYLLAMQSINRAILNPLFYSAFFGALLLLPLSTYINYNLSSLRFWLLMAASVLYAVGLFGVTIAGNVPLNELLDKFDIAGSSVKDIAAMRKMFEPKWNTYHFIRTICVVLSLICVLSACTVNDKN